jgi:hypothetical protein
VEMDVCNKYARTYFTYGNTEVARRGLPWRSGCYVGYVVARRMAERHSLNVLAHLRGAPLRSEIAEVLRQLSRQQIRLRKAIVSPDTLSMNWRWVGKWTLGLLHWQFDPLKCRTPYLSGG